MYVIKQSTGLTVPFFAHDANGDGVTGLVDGGFTKRISKGSGAFGAMTVTITEMENGWYSFPLSGAHTDTSGLLTISFLHASIKSVNLQWRVEARLLDDLATPTNITAGTITTATNVTTVNGLAANVITAASIADGAIDAATFAADVDAEVRSYVGLASANLDTQLDDIDAAIAGIGTAGGAAINTDAATDNYAGGISGVTSGTTKVGTQTNTYTDASSVNGTYHTMTHTGDAIDIVYQFLTGGGTSPVSATWTGYVTGGNDTLTFSVWDHVGGDWESMATQLGQVGTANVVKNIPLYERHQGTSAAELGKVYIRLHCTGQSSPVLNTDQLYVSYSITSRTVGYANGAVWIDTNTGVAGADSFVHGVADNPVLSLADALTIATNNRLRKFEVGNGSSLTLAATTANKVFEGHEWVLALGGQNIASSMFIDASVSGTGTGSFAEFETCEIGTVTLDPCFMHNCSFGSTFTIGAAGDYFFYNCHSSVAGTSAPVIDMGAVGNVTISLRRWSGGLTINNISSGDVVSIDAVSGGTITLNGADGNVQVRGMVNVVDNRTGTPTLGTTNNMDARFDALDTAVATVGVDVVDLKTQIGTAGAGLTAVPWNAAWDAEVESEVNDALVVQRLDELVNADSDIDGAAPPTVGSVVHELMSKTAGSFTYDQTTDSLEAIRDKETDIEADTAEIGVAGAGLSNINLPNQTMDIVGNITGNLSGSVGSVTGAVGSVTGNVGGNVVGSVGSLGATAKSDVNAEVVDALNVDTYAEPGQEAPGATVSLAKKINYLYKFLRNKITQTSTTLSVYNDAETVVDQKATVSDDATTYTRGEIGTGP